MRISNILLLASVLSVAGCASQPSVPAPEFPGMERSDNVVIQDMRPHTEAEKKIFSLMVTSSAYGIYRLADAATAPSGVRLLAHRAYEAFPELATRPSIKVLHFATYSNLQSSLRKSALGAAFGGPIGAVLLSRQSPPPPTSRVLTEQIDSALLETTDEEYRRAFFSKEENPDKLPVNLIYIEAEILNQRVASRCLVPPLADKPNLFLVKALDMCIGNHLALYRTESLPVASASVPK